MNPELSTPPLRDLPQGHLEIRKQHLLAEIERERHLWPWLPHLNLTPRRMTLAAGGASVAVAGFAALVVAMTSAPSHPGQTRVSQPSQSSEAVRTPRGFTPIAVDVVPGASGTSSINVTVSAAFTDASLQLQVLRGQTDGQVVFQENVPMKNISTPSNGSPGTVALSTWSGTLSPSAWDGGCQNTQYVVTAKVSPSDPSATSQMSAESASFSCNSG